MERGRTLSDIDGEITAALALLAGLQAERLQFLADLKAAVLRDFDDGLSREAICKRHGITYPTLSSWLFKAGRTNRSRLAAKLKPERRADYNRLVRQGVRPTLALSIAQTVAS